MASTTKAVVILSIVIVLQVSRITGVVGDIPAVMSVNGFEKGEEGGPAKCDGQYHNDSLFLVALTTQWYQQGLRCGRMINIKSSDGAIGQAMVVDECDT
uniref:Uncharacterized protein n=2 Tax=Aegilops tauschii TaxID=37682 RepID=A0A452ZH15_AEGTS